MKEKNETIFRSGYVAIVGKPNVGKSTLMNTFLDQKLSIVSPRPQTTRNRVLGIANDENYQMIFLDTPGMMDPRYELQQVMLKTTEETLKEADIILCMIDAGGTSPLDETVFKKVMKSSRPKFLAINKIDLVQKKSLLPMIDTLNKNLDFEAIIPISALKKDGCEDLFKNLLEKLPEGDPLYPQDAITDEPERFFVAEIIRETIFIQYGEEIPYATAVRIEKFQERPDQKDYILAIIYIERDSQKAILIGKKGRAIKKLGQSSREQIENFLDRPIFLDLQVRTKKKWRKKPSIIKGLGY